MLVYEKKKNKGIFSVGTALLAVVMLLGALYLSYNYNANDPLPVIYEQESDYVLQLPDFISTDEIISIPYVVNASVATHYFDMSKSDETLDKAIVEFDDVYRPSQGVDYTFDGKVFETVAMISGEVVDVFEDALMGKSISIKSDKGILITYQSLSKINFVVGDMVKQNDVVGLSGENLYNEDLGIHLHVSCMRNDTLVDPDNLIRKKISELN